MSSAVISFGPNYGLLNNSPIAGQYVDQFRLLLQNLDALLYTKCINTTQIVPPTNPNPGDSYLLLGTPSGVWTGHQNKVAFWDAQLTASGSNTLMPGWQFITPQPGMQVYNVALGNFLLFNGSAWVQLSPEGVIVSDPSTTQTVNQPSGTDFEITAAATVLDSALTIPNVIFTADGALASNVLNFADASSGGFTITLPTIPSGNFYIVCRQDATPNTNIVVIESEVGSIEGVESLQLGPGQSVILVWGGFNWFVANNPPIISPAQIQARNLGTNGPVITVAAGAGTGGSASIATGSTDLAGSFTIVTGTAPAANSVLATVTFGTSKPSATWFIATSNTDQPAPQEPIFIGDKSTTGFSVFSGAVAPGAGAPFTYDYIIIQSAV
jgi:hypothetical protein